jgi:quinol monooxygenase YgiN
LKRSTANEREASVVIEYVRYAIPSERAEEFETAYARAAAALQASEHCYGWELSRCVEDPTHYILRIEWDSVDGHVQGFRSSTGFRQFMSDVGPYYSDTEEMRHYARTGVVGEHR